MIKSTVEAKETQERKYPYLGIFEDKKIIVLFEEKNTGMALVDGEYYAGNILGTYTHNFTTRYRWWDGWDESRFTPFHGKITLENSL